MTTSKKSTPKPEKQSTRSKQSVSKTPKPLKKKSVQSSTKPTSQVKRKATKKGLQRDSIYQLDTWKWKYEDVKKPEPRVWKSLKTRIKHAWEVLKG